MQCPYCFSLIEEGKAFCPECGARLTPSVAEPEAPRAAATSVSAPASAASTPADAGPTLPDLEASSTIGPADTAPYPSLDVPCPEAESANGMGPVAPEPYPPLAASFPPDLETTASGTVPPMATAPLTPPAPLPFWRRRIGLFIGLMAFVLLSLSLAIYAGYRAGEGQRRARQLQAATEHYQAGLDAFTAGDYVKAIAEFEYVLKLDPNNALAKTALEQARAAYDFSLTPTPVNVEEQLQRLYDEGRAAYVAGEWAKAAQLLAQLRGLDGTYHQPEVNDMLFSALYNAGMAQLNQDQLEAAIFYFDQALALRPDDAATREQRELAAQYVEAMTLWNTDWAGCIARLSALYTRNPNYRDTRLRLAGAYEAYGDTFAAKNEFCPALQQYSAGIAVMETPTLRDKQNVAGQKCAEATPTPGPSPTPTATPEQTPTLQPAFLPVGQLAYPRYDETTGQYDLYVLYAGGEEFPVAAGADHPWLEWGGPKVFYRDRVNGGLWVVQPGLGQPLRLRSETNLAWPSLSPDRQMLAYAAADDAGAWHIYIAPLDGSSAPRLIADGWAPAWGPTGLIAYTGCAADGACGIYVINPDGQAPVRLTSSENDTAAAWAPTGDRLAFMALDQGNWDVLLVDLAGTITPLVADATNEGLPTWSPNGTQLAFVSQREGGWSVYLISVNGGVPVKLLDLGTLPGNWMYQRIYWAP